MVIAVDILMTVVGGAVAVMLVPCSFVAATVLLRQMPNDNNPASWISMLYNRMMQLLLLLLQQRLPVVVAVVEASSY